MSAIYPSSTYHWTLTILSNRGRRQCQNGRQTSKTAMMAKVAGEEWSTVMTEVTRKEGR